MKFSLTRATDLANLWSNGRRMHMSCFDRPVDDPATLVAALPILSEGMIAVDEWIAMPLDALLLSLAVTVVFLAFAGTLAWADRQTSTKPDRQTRSPPDTLKDPEL